MSLCLKFDCAGLTVQLDDETGTFCHSPEQMDRYSDFIAVHSEFI